MNKIKENCKLVADRIDKRVSYTSLSLYQKCPYAFKLGYIDKVEVEIINKYIERGKKLHSDIPAFYDEVEKRGTIFFPEDKNLSYFFRELYTFYVKFLGVDEAYRYFLTRKNEFELKTDYYLGYIDELRYTPTDEYWILEYKSGFPHKRSILSAKTQLGFYVSFFYEKFGVIPKISLVYFGAIKRPIALHPSQDECVLNALFLSRLVSDGVKRENFNPNLSSCSFFSRSKKEFFACPFGVQGYCKFFGGGKGCEVSKRS